VATVVTVHWSSRGRHWRRLENLGTCGDVEVRFANCQPTLPRVETQSTGISGTYCFLKGNEEIIDPMFDEEIVICSGL